MAKKEVKNVRRIIASHPDKIDVKLVEAKLAELTEAGHITERDESLLEHLRI
jgi:predicted translin family RNA/ssDNA-binding protein